MILRRHRIAGWLVAAAIWPVVATVGLFILAAENDGGTGSG